MSAPAHGADTPQGPGWWLASDGRYYPPELAPKPTPAAATDEVASTQTSDAKPRKKVVKKVAAKKPATAKAKSSSTAKPAAKPAAAKAGSRDATDDASIADKRSGQQKFTARAPATDQIAARRIQAKEQSVLLANARQQAALRALSGISRSDEPVLVGVGGRSLEARTDHKQDPVRVTQARTTASPADDLVAPSVAPDPAPVVEPDVEPSVTPPPSAQTATPVEATPVEATPVEATPDAPATAETAATPTTAPAEAKAAAPAPTPSPPEAAAGETVAPHEPEKKPEAAAPMGTDVPFMEIKGSALATDLDRLGERILIFSDRVEQRDRGNTARRVVSYDMLASVDVVRKLMGPSLVITGMDGTTITAKALRPELASGAKAMIDKHAERFRGTGAAPAPDASAPAKAAEPVRSDASTEPAPQDRSRPTHKAVLLGMLEELHAAGVLSSDELETKKALIEFTSRP
jgi:hypothetical protein